VQCDGTGSSSSKGAGQAEDKSGTWRKPPCEVLRGDPERAWAGVRAQNSGKEDYVYRGGRYYADSVTAGGDQKGDKGLSLLRGVACT